MAYGRRRASAGPAAAGTNEPALVSALLPLGWTHSYRHAQIVAGQQQSGSKSCVCAPLVHRGEHTCMHTWHSLSFRGLFRARVYALARAIAVSIDGPIN